MAAAHSTITPSAPLAFTTSDSARGAHLFQPPKSPASPPISSSNDYFSSRSRKRARPDSSHSQTPRRPLRHQQQETPSWTQCPTPEDPIYQSSAAAPQVNERYRLAGGLDTPGLLAFSENEQSNDLDFRRCVRDRESMSRRGEAAGGRARLSGPLARERNGVGRMPAQLTSPNRDDAGTGGWTSLAFGIVGKVFTFGSSIMRGFYAGGGKGYDLSQSAPSRDSWMHSPLHQRTSNPIPGAWTAEDGFLGDFEQDNPTDTPTNRPAAMRPPNKRRQTDRDSWVIIGTPDPTPTSPRRTTSSVTPARPSLTARPTASRANSRRSLAPAVSRRQSSHTGTPAQQQQQQQQPQALPTATTTAVTGLDTPSMTRRASFAQSRAPTSRPSTARPSTSGGAPNGLNGACFITPEAERYLKRQARQEKANEKSMSSMSRQLEDLIRLGREALGTKISVEGDEGFSYADMDVDEGFVDEGW